MIAPAQAAHDFVDCCPVNQENQPMNAMPERAMPSEAVQKMMR
jgi:hypothetical protein